ncbi:MAG: hypothetical protein JSW10_02365 [Pseudomonadota bacterium]|nr:MAG: hypothetical protein JSW10_02365 [Pseudomonadota bacterium]
MPDPVAGNDANTKALNSRIDKLPRYSGQPFGMDASRYNRVRRGLLRLHGPLTFRAPGLRHLDVILEPDAWICVDASLNDIPVFAWTDFEVKGRSALHEPVRCKLYTYHAHALIIVDRILEAIEDHLDTLLQDRLGNR